MTLRKKTIVTLILTLAVLMVFLYVVLSFLMMGSYADLEAQAMRRDVQRAANALDRDMEELRRTASDWAPWDSTRDFVQGTNDTYEANNLVDVTFIDLRLNIMLFFDEDNQQVYGKAFDLVDEEQMTMPAGLERLLATHTHLFEHADAQQSQVGLVLLPEGPMLLVSYPISDSNYGPIAGTLMMGRFLSAAEIERMATLAEVSLSAERWDAAQMPPDMQAARAELATRPVYVQPMDEQQIAGYTVQHDMHGEPALLLRVVSPRTITAQGQANLHYMLLALLAVGLVFGAVSLWLLERFVLARLSHLNASVTSIADNAMLDTRIEVQGNDELAHLGATMNQMFDALERSYRHQGDVNVQLQSSRDLLRAIFDTIDDGLLLLDHRGNVLAANQAMSLLFSRTSKDLFGQSWERLCRLPLPGACSAQMHFPGLWVLDTLRDGQPRQQRERLSCNDRSIRVFDMQAMPIYHGKAIDESPRQVSQVVLHVIDVTEQLQMEAMMVDTARLTANKRLSQIVAHEVNSPLQTILFSLEMMQDAEATERHRFLNVAQSEVERIGKILHQLKDLYHRQSDERSLTDINMLVERVLLLVSGTLARHEIEVERCLTPNVPLLRASGDQLMQVLLNLTLNALDAMPNGGRLRVSSFFAEYALAQQLDAAGNGATPHDMHHTCLAIEIADTGSGMEPAVQARIFEPFYTTKTDGSGLGLAVCHKIIEEHDGCIDVESRHGAGTTFRILLPCSAKEQP